MKNYSIEFTEETEKDYKEYGYQEFVRKVLHKCPDKRENGIIGKIIIFDVEVSKRVYLKNENNEEFTIRYFIQDQNEKQWSASYTLYKSIDDGDGSGHGEEIYCGHTNVKYI